MRVSVSLQWSGGIAGLRRQSASVDEAALPAAQAHELRRLVEAANAIENARTPASPSPDEMFYTITVHEDGRERVIQFRDSAIPGPCEALLAFLDRIERT